MLPPLATYDRIGGWWQQLLARTGTDPQSGLKLFPWFVAAGLPSPVLRTGRALGGGADFFGYEVIASAVRSALPLLEEYGIATADEVEIDTLEVRLRADAVAGGGVLGLPMYVGAWAYKP